MSVVLRWYGDAVIAKMVDAGTDGLVAYGTIILGIANLNCPVRTGRLRSTGKVTRAWGVVFVGYNTSYAVRLHEHPEYHFANGKTGKWLEVAAFAATGAEGVVGAVLKRLLA